jgi:multiple sugar transport system permease protein
MAVAIRAKAKNKKPRGSGGRPDGDAQTPPASWANRDRAAAFGLLAPNLILYAVFIVIPILLALALSFTSWNLVGAPQWAGLANYHAMLNDPAVPQAIETTMIFLVFGVVPTVVLGLLLAILVNVQFRGIGVVRTLYFVPAVVSFAASAILWQWIYRPGQGFLDFALQKVFGITGPAWLSNTHTALIALDIIGIWLSLPTAILLYLAALQRIPPQVIEAAMLDGAGPFTRLRKIIWPGVRNMTILVVIVSIIAFTNSSFDLVNILTQGGPVNATSTLIYYIYYTAFNNIQLGYAATLSVLQLALFAAILGLLALARRFAQ